MYVYISLSIYIYIYLSIYLSLYVSIYLSLSTYIYIYIYMPLLQADGATTQGIPSGPKIFLRAKKQH